MMYTKFLLLMELVQYWFPKAIGNYFDKLQDLNYVCSTPAPRARFLFPFHHA